jgi:hypothetical protein
MKKIISILAIMVITMNVMIGQGQFTNTPLATVHSYKQTGNWMYSRSQTFLREVDGKIYWKAGDQIFEFADSTLSQYDSTILWLQ